MSGELGIENFEIVNDLLLVSFSDQSESMVPLQVLRERCPCASCEGETDALGNLYKGSEQKLTALSFQVSGIQPVGYYGIRPFWKDGHNTGIYTGEKLKSLSQ
jgi:DUF971 family protein